MRYIIRSILLLGVFLLAGLLGANTYTSLTVGILGSRDSLTVHGNIAFLEPDSSRQITLLLNPDAVVHAMFFSNEEDSITVSYERLQGDTIIVFRPTEPAFANSRVFSFDLAIPLPSNDSLIMFDRGNRWYPVLLHGLTTSIVNVFCGPDRAVFSTGDETTQEYTGVVLHQFASKIPVYKIPLLMTRIGHYRSCSRIVGGHEIVFNYFSISDSLALSIIDEAASAFAFYQDMLGEYHHKKLTINEVPGFEGTNIGTGILMVGTPTIKAIAAGQREPLTLTIASQWFGAGVFCDFPSQGFWFMSVSLSHYLRILYECNNLDSTAFAAKVEDNLAAYSKIAGSENDIAIIDIVRPDSRKKGLVIYSKGPAIVHKLRSCLGSDVWNSRIREFYRSFLGKVIDIDDLVNGFTLPDSDCDEQLTQDLGRKGI